MDVRKKKQEVDDDKQKKEMVSGISPRRHQNLSKRKEEVEFKIRRRKRYWFQQDSERLQDIQKINLEADTSYRKNNLL